MQKEGKVCMKQKDVFGMEVGLGASLVVMEPHLHMHFLIHDANADPGM